MGKLFPFLSTNFLGGTALVTIGHDTVDARTEDQNQNQQERENQEKEPKKQARARQGVQGKLASERAREKFTSLWTVQLRKRNWECCPIL